MTPNKRVIIFSAIYHYISQLTNTISFRHQQKQQEKNSAKQMPGIHQNVCPFCQCRWSFPGCETPVNDDDNGSVDEDDNKDADSEMGNLEN